MFLSPSASGMSRPSFAREKSTNRRLSDSYGETDLAMTQTLRAKRFDFIAQLLSKNRVLAPPHILRVSNGFKMVWTDAGWLLAKVVKFHTFGNRPYFLSVHRSMSAGLLFLDSDHSIPEPMCTLVRPDPAWRQVAAILDRVVVRSENADDGVVAMDVPDRFVFASLPTFTRLTSNVRLLTAATLAVAIRDRVFGHAASFTEVVLRGSAERQSPRSLHSICGACA